MDVRSNRLRAQMQVKDVVTAVNLAGFPKYDKFLNSKVENPAYGVRLVPKAEQAVGAIFASHGIRTGDRHTKRLIPYRVDAELYGRLQQAQETLGCDTMQDTVDRLVNLGLEALEKEE